MIQQLNLQNSKVEIIIKMKTNLNQLIHVEENIFNIFIDRNLLVTIYNAENKEKFEIFIHQIKIKFLK